MADTSPQIARPDEEGLDRAAALLAAGDPVAMPTETVYGLAADACDGEAVAKIYAAKGRPSFNPLIAHVSGPEMAARYAAVDELAADLMRRYWPGPLTLVLPARAGSGLASIVTAGLPTVALRMPDHPVPQALIARLGRPLAAPSANRSGSISPTRAEHVARSLGAAVPLILDGGACSVGLESTIVAVTDGALRLLRPGRITAEDLGVDPAPQTAQRIEAPGMMLSHYAPAKPLRLNAETARDDEFHIGFGSVAGDFNLSPGGDLVEAAARLFAALHAADASDKSAIAAAPIPKAGLGAAINDRLTRAAHA
ncbi:L-threonylcarbamoyladenylate synthase [Pacificimonas flava]|uniref:Threonylcarbamoyl-AMP synthase n=1 Tax=Pacificimonas flava TaxID=1234595 RepID=M2U1P6_9SPHN|nr:L-threonylcarbamoyladenylate synthase [Pacificimonas flava]EMD81748.1 YrdC/Sua5 family protein, required for threonylcarbamoyladenosine (t(6)A) formation in tRNA [Pacificimonas flava]MBB5279318.1 L-threonylcarbamoyladenylate synthase [Pacificimonas flava]